MDLRCRDGDSRGFKWLVCVFISWERLEGGAWHEDGNDGSDVDCKDGI